MMRQDAEEPKISATLLFNLIPLYMSKREVQIIDRLRESLSEIRKEMWFLKREIESVSGVVTRLPLKSLRMQIKNLKDELEVLEGQSNISIN